MFDSSELRDQLQALKGDMARLMNTKNEGTFESSKNRAEALSDQIATEIHGSAAETCSLRRGRCSRKCLELSITH